MIKVSMDVVSMTDAVLVDFSNTIYVQESGVGSFDSV